MPPVLRRGRTHRTDRTDRTGRTHRTGRMSRAPRAARALLVPLVAMAAGCVVEATWTPQAVEPVADPVPDRFALTDVACPEEGACVAVGSLGTLPTTSELAVLRQDGASWRRVDAPVALPGARAVSCAAADDCLVLGAIDLRYRDGELAVLPGPPLDARALGGAVDCAPGGGCLRTDGLASAWWDGTAWSDPAPLPSGMMRETPQLSCVSETSCLLVATEPGIEGWPTPGTVTSTTWDGTAWSPVVTLDHDTRPLDLDCATETACVATAGVRADYWTDLLPPAPAEVLRWDGSAWTVETIAYPGAGPTEPGTVSCPSATSCTVLSVAGRDTPPSPTVLARWDGTAWTGAATDAASPVVALACTSATSCTSAGNEVAQRYDGTTWSDTDPPGATSPAEVLAGVSCAEADACVAVGSAWTMPGGSAEPTRAPTVHHYDGDEWVAADAGERALRHVSCATPSSCMVAGSDLGTFWTRHWDGHAWRELPPVESQRAFTVTALSCPAAAWCLLTTSSFSGGGDVGWVWTGGDTWTTLAALPPQTGTTTGLSCPAPGDCVAVANWIGPQAFRLAGNAWTPIDLTDLGLGTIANLTDVNCPAADACALVGRAGFAEDGRPQALLAVLSGGTWSRATRPSADAMDVDCWSAGGCVAVVSGDDPHLELWDGARWRKVENPPGVVHPTRVSCGAAGRCEVVGAFVDGADERATVAEVVVEP
jgi:hypothetical protein